MTQTIISLSGRRVLLLPGTRRLAYPHGEAHAVGNVFLRPYSKISSALTMTQLKSPLNNASMMTTSYHSILDRQFSSTDLPSNELPTPGPPNRRSVLQQSTLRLLEAPMGSLVDQHWSEARYTILGWMEPPSLPPKDKDFIALGLLQSFALLDRLVQEEKTPRREEKEQDSSIMRTIPDFFKTGFLNLVLNHWRKNILSGELKISNEETLELGPRHLLQRLYHYQQVSACMQPDNQTFGMLLDTISSLVAVSSSVSTHTNISLSTFDGDYGLMTVVDEIIERLVATARNIDPSENPGFVIRPNVYVFSSAMNAWVKSGLREAPTKVEKLLEQMKVLKEEYPDWPDISPSQYTYTTVIDAWAKVGNAEKVQDLLREMYEVSRETKDESLRPGLIAFTGYLVALSKQGRMEEAEDMLNQMEDLYESGEVDEPPNVVSYSTVLDGYARSTKPWASARAENLLQRMLEKHRDGDVSVVPNSVSFNSVIFSHMKIGNIQAAESLLRLMHEEYLRHGNKDIRPTLETYSTVLSGLAKSHRKDAGERAEKLLKYVKDMAEAGDLDNAPDVVLYNTVLECWAKSSVPESPVRAKYILDTMVDDGVTPDVISFNTVIHCMAKSNQLEVAEGLLKKMEQAGVHANVITYNTLLSAYVTAVSSKKHGNFPDTAKLTHRVEQLFDRLKLDSRVSVDVVTYNTVLNFYSRTGEVDKATSLLKEMLVEQSLVAPDLFSMNTVISAWSNSGRPDAPECAEAILEQVLLRGGQPPHIRPNSVTFNSVMSAWTRSRRPEAATRCQRLFDLMNMNSDENLWPDFITYNILIHAWSLSTDEAAPEHAERVYKEMNRRFERGDVQLRPNNKTFGALINVWSRSRRMNAGEMAELYLRKIVSNAEQQRSAKDLPRVHEFTSTIRAWANSNDPRAPYKADEILYLLLQQVEQGNKLAQPDHRLFGAFLLALATSGVLNKGMYANRVVQLMIKFKIRPNAFLLELLNRCHGATIFSVES
jgi:pentatricopeptide repeat protein